MRRITLLLAVAICMLACTSAVAQQLTGTLKKIKDSGAITFGHRESSIPFAYYDDQQNVVGYSLDICMRIVDAVKRELKMPNLQVRPIPVTPQNRMTLIQNGTIDIECGSTTNNLERQQQVAFSDTTFIISTRLMTKKGSPIKDFPDLAGKVVVTSAGTTDERILIKMNEEKKMGMKIISARDHSESFLTLETGRAVAFMMDDVLLYGERAKARKPDDWVVVGTPQSYEAYGIMIRKGDPQFKKLADSVISNMETSGEMEKFYRKWFLSPIPPKGFNLNFPLSQAMIELFKNPNDKAFQ